MYWQSWGHYKEAKSGRPYFEYSKYHITEDGKKTLCGITIPQDTGYGSLRDSECKRCLAKLKKLGLNRPSYQ